MSNEHNGYSNELNFFQMNLNQGTSGLEKKVSTGLKNFNLKLVLPQTRAQIRINQGEKSQMELNARSLERCGIISLFRR